MLSLALDAHPQGSRKLIGCEDVVRIRVGRYGILYSIAAQRLIIIILNVGRRRDVYGS